MNFLIYVMIGITIGWLASVVMNEYGVGVVKDVLVGVAGSVIFGSALGLLNLPYIKFSDTVGVALIGSILVLYFWNHSQSQTS